MRNATMVRRSYSRVFYCIPIVFCLLLIPTTIELIRDLMDLGQSCDNGLCSELTNTEIQENVLELIAALLIALGWYLRWRKSAKRDQLRQAAARGEGRAISLEDVQLTDERATLALLHTIRLRMAWRSRMYKVVFTAVFLIVQVVIGCTLLAHGPIPRGSLPLPVIGLLAEAGFLVFLALLYLFLFVAARERLGVTEEGLRARWFGIPQRARWNEARLFAQVRENRCELASPRASVRFTYLHDTDAQEPLIPYDEYRRLMASVLTLIAERTGLPLMDLRDPKDR